MNRFAKYIQTLLLFGGLAFLLPSCEKVLDLNDKRCDYSVRIDYHYNEENSSATNKLAQVVSTLSEYLFDADGILYAINPLKKDSCTGQWISELDLPPGRYSVIAVGNRSSMSEITDNGASLRIGVTNRENLLMTLANSTQARAGANEGFSNCGRLYHGYRTFRVEPDQVGSVRVDMVHSHCIINFRIRWKNNTPPMGAYYSLMQYIPSEYRLMPEYVYTEPKADCDAYDCATHDLYALKPNWVKHHITTVKQDCNIVDHRVNLYRNGDGEVIGQFVTYRIKNETEPTISLWTDSTRAGTQVMKEINLQKYFRERGINHDSSLRQEYNIEILIDGEQVFVMGITIGDWQEGGAI